MCRLLMMAAALAASVSLAACAGMSDYSTGEKSTHDKGMSDESMHTPAPPRGGY